MPDESLQGRIHGVRQTPHAASGEMPAQQQFSFWPALSFQRLRLRSVGNSHRANFIDATVSKGRLIAKMGLAAYAMRLFFLEGKAAIIAGFPKTLHPWQGQSRDRIADQLRNHSR